MPTVRLPAPVALARSVDTLRPLGVREPVWEPKWDGYRALYSNGRLVSRRGTDLTRLFPDLAPVTLARLDPASGRRAEVAELALAIAALLAERGAWHEQNADHAGAHAITRARPGVLVLAAGSSSLRRDDVSHGRSDPVQLRRPTGPDMPPPRRS